MIDHRSTFPAALLLLAADSLCMEFIAGRVSSSPPIPHSLDDTEHLLLSNYAPTANCWMRWWAEQSRFLLESIQRRDAQTLTERICLSRQFTLRAASDTESFNESFAGSEPSANLHGEAFGEAKTIPSRCKIMREVQGERLGAVD
jgi:hypothetical protein